MKDNKSYQRNIIGHVAIRTTKKIKAGEGSEWSAMWMGGFSEEKTLEQKLKCE